MRFTVLHICDGDSSTPIKQHVAVARRVFIGLSAMTRRPVFTA